MINEFINQNLNFLTFFIGILWGIILDGIFVERGRGYIKIKVIEKSWQFKRDEVGFIFYIIHVSYGIGMIDGYRKKF